MGKRAIQGNPEIRSETPPNHRPRIGLSNRRYLGSKTKILDTIENEIVGVLGRTPVSLFDAFAGSGVVGGRFASKGVKVVMNDLLFHNSLAHRAFLLHGNYDQDRIESYLYDMEKSPPLRGYITENFGGKYFSVQNAMLLDSWREYLAIRVQDPPTLWVLLTSLLYAADKIAQTVGHYDAYFVRNAVDRKPELRLLDQVGTGSGHKIYNRDTNSLIGEIEVEVLYLDPPYNSRQYSDTYHVLENIARWEKPDVFGVARKMDRSALKSRYSGKRAEEAFEDLVTRAKAELIILSYSNTGDSRVSRSNNVLSDTFITGVLRSRGNVRIREIDFKEFSVGRTSKRAHQERLFICEVGR